MDIKIEVVEGKKTTTLKLNTTPTEEAINKAAKSMEDWLRKTFVKETKETIV